MKGGKFNMETLAATTTSLVTLVTSAMGLFETFPLNIMITATLVAVAFKIFGKGRRATGAGN